MRGDTQKALNKIIKPLKELRITIVAFENRLKRARDVSDAVFKAAKENRSLMQDVEFLVTNLINDNAN